MDGLALILMWLCKVVVWAVGSYLLVRLCSYAFFRARRMEEKDWNKKQREQFQEHRDKIDN